MVTDHKMDPAGKAALKCITLQLGTTATSQTGKKTDSTVPGFAFEIVAVEVNALTVTATMAMDIQIAGTTALSATITPVAATPTAGTLSTTLSARRGSATAAIQLLYTSGSSGAATNGVARVWIRPRPLNGEVAFS